MRGVKTKENTKWKRIGLFLLVFLVMILLLNSVKNVYKKKIEAEETLARMNSEVAELQDRKNDLNQSLERLKTEEGMKFEMRKRLNVSEHGESVAIIVNDESKNSVKTEKTFWQKTKDFFANLIN